MRFMVKGIQHIKDEKLAYSIEFIGREYGIKYIMPKLNQLFKAHDGDLIVDEQARVVLKNGEQFDVAIINNEIEISNIMINREHIFMISYCVRNHRLKYHPSYQDIDKSKLVPVSELAEITYERYKNGRLSDETNNKLQELKEKYPLRLKNENLDII